MFRLGALAVDTLSRDTPSSRFGGGKISEPGRAYNSVVLAVMSRYVFVSYTRPSSPPEGGQEGGWPGW